MSWTIHTDVRITRRKRLSHVYDVDDCLRYSSRSLADCLIWLIDNDATSAVLYCGNTSMLITLELARP